jgi:hypothetical protein
LKYRTFPALKDFAVEFPLPKKEKVEEKTFVWTSSKAPGTPASVECLFLMIEEGRTETTGFKYGLQHTGFNEDELFEMYADWQQGKLNARLKDYKEKKFRL